MKKKTLFLTLCLILLSAFVLTSCGKKEDGPKKEKKPVGIAVAQANENVGAAESFTVRLAASVTSENMKDFEDQEVSVEVKYAGTNLQLSVSASKLENPIVAYVTNGYSIDSSIIFNLKDFGQATEDQFVEITISEIMELVSGMMPKPEPNPGEGTGETEEPTEPGMTIDPKLALALANISDFFTSIKDEYFDANNEKGYYEFNQVGKDTVQSLINDLVEGISKQTGYEIKLDELVKYSYDIHVTTGEKYLEKIEFTGEVESLEKESAGQKVKLSAAVEFKEYGNTTVTLPENVIKYKDLMETPVEPE